MRTALLVAWCVVAAFGSAARGNEGLVADYRFDEGTGTILHDRAAAGNHGTIHGAVWVRFGDSFALRFDGKDDYVDFGRAAAVDLGKAVSLEAWVYPESVPGAGEPGVAGQSYGSYVLTYYAGGRLWWYISGGANKCQAAAPPGTWHHVVGTFDGRQIKLYLDGALADTTQSKVATIGQGGRFLIGTSSGDPQYTKGAHFQGMVTGVRVYDRALSPAEVARHYGTTRRTNEIALRAYVYPASASIVADADLRGLGELPEGAALVAELYDPQTPRPLATGKVSSLPASGAVEVSLQAGTLTPGQYELRAAVVGKDGSRVGRLARLPVAWPDRPRLKEAPGAKVLNNLVTELLAVAGPPDRPDTAWEFVNPREGWVFFASIAKGQARPVALSLDGQPLHTHQGPGTVEAMRCLTQGPHRLRVGGAAGLERLVVRAVPELVYSKFGADPLVQEFGKYGWTFLAKHVLPNINVLVVSGGKEQEPLLRQWRAQGKRCLVECGVPGLQDTEPVTADAAEKQWSAGPGMTDPLLDGVLADEFWAGLPDAKYAAWTEALRRLQKNDRLKNRLFYPYCGPMNGSQPSRRFIQAVMDARWRFAFERYLPEQRSQRAARAFLDTSLRQAIAAWRRDMPGAEQRMIVCLGTFSQPPESLDVNPATNHKVFLDMQMNLLANDPECFGIGGVMTYLSSYTDEETIRWMGRLFRHYCIEGRSEPLCRDPYVLPHLQNPDFEDGTAGWTVAAAEPGSVAARSHPGFSWLQGRYPPTGQGDSVLWMKRSSQRANTVGQAVKSLVPGRLYTLRFYSGDCRDLSVKQTLALSVELAGAEILREKSFQHVFANCYSHHYGPFDDKHPAWMNYHWFVFRPSGREAMLKICDWAKPSEPGGPVGQELMVNFVQVQPYDE